MNYSFCGISSRQPGKEYSCMTVSHEDGPTTLYFTGAVYTAVSLIGKLIGKRQEQKRDRMRPFEKETPTKWSVFTILIARPVVW